MKFEDDLIKFWDYMPTFHDASIDSVLLKDNDLVLQITTKVSKILHTPKLYEAFEKVYTTIKFHKVSVAELYYDKAGQIVIDFSYVMKGEQIKCLFECVFGDIKFACDDISIEKIETKPNHHKTNHKTIKPRTYPNREVTPGDIIS